MMDILEHPALGSLIFTLLVLWPLARIMRRAGHNPYLAVLVVLNLAVPMLGLIAVGIVLCRKPRNAAGTGVA